MTDIERRPRRNKEVLQLITDHGPVSIDMLHRMTEPHMEKKNLRQLLGILKKKSLVDMVSLDSQTAYYQIFQSLPSRKQIAEILGCNVEDAIHPLLRRKDWLHNQWCEYWALSIKRKFPEARIVREHMIAVTKRRCAFFNLKNTTSNWLLISY